MAAIGATREAAGLGKCHPGVIQNRRQQLRGKFKAHAGSMYARGSTAPQSSFSVMYSTSGAKSRAEVKVRVEDRNQVVLSPAVSSSARFIPPAYPRFSELRTTVCPAASMRAKLSSWSFGEALSTTTNLQVLGRAPDGNPLVDKRRSTALGVAARVVIHKQGRKALRVFGHGENLTCVFRLGSRNRKLVPMLPHVVHAE